jgi:hypothetical protein
VVGLKKAFHISLRTGFPLRTVNFLHSPFQCLPSKNTTHNTKLYLNSKLKLVTFLQPIIVIMHGKASPNRIFGEEKNQH